MKTVELDKENNILLIRFKSPDRDEWLSLLTFVKTLSGRCFDNIRKLWTVPNIQSNLDQLKEFGFTANGESTTTPITCTIDLNEWKKIKIDKKLLPGLRSYQIDAMRFLKWRKGKALIGDEMGTGKTCMALSWAKLNNFKRPLLIIVPATIKLQWRREFRQWYSKSKSIEILYGQKPYELSKNKCYIINWDIITYWQKELKEIKFDYIIGDEIQYISNPKSLRSKAFKKIAKPIPNIVELSGTPIKSKPVQFYSALKLLNPEMFKNHWAYLNRYCEPKSNGFGMTFNGATNIEELHELVSSVMIRREKKDILKDLPAKIKVVVPLDGTNQSEYKTKSEEVGGLGSLNRDSFESLKYSAFESKKNAVIKWITDFIDSGQKLVVFAYHRMVVDYLFETFKKQAVRVYGGSSKKERDESITRFIDDKKVSLFIGNILAAGVGVDGLQKVCSNSCFVEFAKTPADHLQAEDRLHRLGQKDSVSAYYLIAPDTIDEELMETLDEGYKVLEGVLNGREMEEMDLLTMMLKKYKQEN